VIFEKSVEMPKKGLDGMQRDMLLLEDVVVCQVNYTKLYQVATQYNDLT